MHRTSAKCREYGKIHQFCEVCGDYGIQVHHIRSRGAGGDDEAINLMSLCPEHHTEYHTIGHEKFGVKYGLSNRIKEALNRSKAK